MASTSPAVSGTFRLFSMKTLQKRFGECVPLPSLSLTVMLWIDLAWDASGPVQRE
jgi:hypothetical protein